MASVYKYSLCALLTIFLASCGTIKRPEKKATQEISDAKQVQSSIINVALVVPLSGEHAKIGKNISDAAHMALSDLGSRNIKIAAIDSAHNYLSVLKQLDMEKPKIIFGPVFTEEVEMIYTYAQKNNICMVTFSNDKSLSGKECLMLLGIMPEASVNKTLTFAKTKGYSDFRMLLPDNKYGQAIAQSLADIKPHFYPPNNGRLRETEIAAVLASSTRYTAISIPEGGEVLAEVATEFADKHVGIKLLGSSAWENEKLFTQPGLLGAWFASLPGEKKQVFERKFIKKFGYKPLKIASLGYDAIALLPALLEADKGLTKAGLTAPEGFTGVTGTFRFTSNGLNERLLSVYEIRNGQAIEISKAADEF